MAPTNRPSNFGGKKVLKRKISDASKESKSRKFAAISAKKRQAAIDQILVAYTIGWTCLHKRYRHSLTGIATGLSREQLVSFSGNFIMPLLKKLARQRKIKLPKTPPKGSSRKKKQM